MSLSRSDLTSGSWNSMKETQLPACGENGPDEKREIISSYPEFRAYIHTLPLPVYLPNLY